MLSEEGKIDQLYSNKRSNSSYVHYKSSTRIKTEHDLEKGLKTFIKSFSRMKICFKDTKVLILDWWN